MILVGFMFINLLLLLLSNTHACTHAHIDRQTDIDTQNVYLSLNVKFLFKSLSTGSFNFILF